MEISKHNKSALLMGATTLVGRKCLLRLLQHDAYQRVVVLMEEPLNFKHKKLEVHQVTFERLPDFQQYMQVSDVFYTWTHQMQIKDDFGKYQPEKTYAYQLAKLAIEAGARQFLLQSSIAADKDNVLYYRQERKSLEEAVCTLDYWGMHIFRPGPLMEEQPKSRLNRWFKTATKTLNNWAEGGLTKYTPIAAQDVARAMVFKAQQFLAGVHIYSAEYLQEFSNEQESGLSNDE